MYWYGPQSACPARWILVEIKCNWVKRENREGSGGNGDYGRGGQAQAPGSMAGVL